MGSGRQARLWAYKNNPHGKNKSGLERIFAESEALIMQEFTPISENGVGVLALGNFKRLENGEKLLNELQANLPSGVEFLDGEIPNLALLSFLGSKEHLIVLDAEKSGPMVLAEILYWAYHTGQVPENIEVIGVDKLNGVEESRVVLDKVLGLLH